MINNEIFTSPEKCIEECDKQISFASNMIVYLEQYKVQLETMKTMANSAKMLKDVNPFTMMNKFMDVMSSSTDMINKSMQKTKSDDIEKPETKKDA
ncbi:MAG: hypothetical protein PHC75_00160 [Burkholderiales bacterium]|nr:hypothetical protein [Burkholderiales bacterium]